MSLHLKIFNKTPSSFSYSLDLPSFLIVLTGRWAAVGWLCAAHGHHQIVPLGQVRVRDRARVHLVLGGAGAAAGAADRLEKEAREEK